MPNIEKMTRHAINFCTIPLTKGYYAIVDPEDFNYLVQWNWFAKIGGRGGEPYAARSTRQFGKIITIRMHREITNAPDGMEVDHLNFNTLDNRRKNLEVVTKAENLKRRRNRKLFPKTNYCDEIPF